MGKLTAAKAKSLSEPGMHGDGGTLFLRVSPGGSKSWVQRVTIHGKRRDIGLGGFPVVSLEKARRRAFENRVAIADGLDPLATKRKEALPTFMEAAKKTYVALRPRWRNEKVAKNWIQQLERHAFKRLGDIRVDKIGREDVLGVLTPIWTSKPETARRVRRYIKAVLSWCQANGYLDTNFAGEAIDGALPSMPSVKAHFRSLPYTDIPRAIEIIRNSQGFNGSKGLP